MKLVVNGREAYAYTGGKNFDATRPTVVFIHGALHDHSVWTLLARWCAHHGHGVLALDLPGHMRSAGPALTSVGAMADWVLAAMTAAGVQRAALVGHSMGSLIALEATARAPERVTRLVMVGTAYPMKVSAPLLESALKTPQAAIATTVQYSFSTLAPKPGYPGPGHWVRGAGQALNRLVLARSEAAGDPALFHTDFAACDAYANGLEAAAKVACPVHFILGARDQMTVPKASRELATALKARVHTLPCGHLPMGEAPEGTLAALRVALA